jgi:predicted RNase H-like HicB family nuclease
MKLQYPVLIERGDEDTAWGIIVPDLPGCFSAADNEADILDNAREAILLHLSALEDIPVPSSLTEVKAEEGMVISLIDIDLAGLEGPAKRINITVPVALLSRIDAAAKAKGVSRSSYMTESALMAV